VAVVAIAGFWVISAQYANLSALSWWYDGTVRFREGRDLPAPDYDLTTLPCLLVGSAGGKIRPGRFLDLVNNHRDNNQLLISLAHAMGADDLTTFGDPSGAMGPLPGLT
jgi:hypothetical protein